MNHEPVAQDLIDEMMECLDADKSPSPKLQAAIETDSEVAKLWDELRQVESDLDDWQPDADAPSPSDDLKNNIMASLPEKAAVVDAAEQKTTKQLFLSRVALPVAVAAVFAVIMLLVDRKQPVPPEHLIDPNPKTQISEIIKPIDTKKVGAAIDEEVAKVSTLGQNLSKETKGLFSLPTKLLPTIPVANVETTPVPLTNDNQNDEQSNISAITLTQDQC